MDDKQIAKLIRKNAARAERLAKAREGRKYDGTLSATRKNAGDLDEDIERERFFKEMKRREF